LDIKKDNIGRELENLLDRRGAIPTFSDDLYIRELAEADRDSTPSQRLVVNN
jgi:hypothetical protein